MSTTVLPERLPGRKAAAVEHPRQEGDEVERGGGQHAAHHGRQLHPERQVRRRRHLRRPLHLLQHRPAQVPHHDQRQVHEGQELGGQEGHGNRADARRGQGD